MILITARRGAASSARQLAAASGSSASAAPLAASTAAFSTCSSSRGSARASALTPRRSHRVSTAGSARALHRSAVSRRAVPTDDADEPFDLSQVERVADEADVVICGGGPAGLSAAIRIKQLAEEKGEEIRVVLLEKGPEVGNHILSGAVIQTNALDELLPNWKELGAPLNQPATEDHMRFLTEKGSFPLPHPPQMSNKGNYIVSLSRVVAWLAEQAEAAGVEIYPGFAGASIIWDQGPDGKKKGIKGIVTNEIGLDKSRKPKDSFEPGMEFRAPITLFAEGAHGSLTQQLIRELGLREAVGADPQTYALGIKEVWKVKPEKHQPGVVHHSLGWPKIL